MEILAVLAVVVLLLGAIVAYSGLVSLLEAFGDLILQVVCGISMLLRSLLAPIARLANLQIALSTNRRCTRQSDRWSAARSLKSATDQVTLIVGALMEWERYDNRYSELNEVKQTLIAMLHQAMRFAHSQNWNKAEEQAAFVRETAEIVAELLLERQPGDVIKAAMEKQVKTGPRRLPATSVCPRQEFDEICAALA